MSALFNGGPNFSAIIRSSLTSPDANEHLAILWRRADGSRRDDVFWRRSSPRDKTNLLYLPDSHDCCRVIIMLVRVTCGC